MTNKNPHIRHPNRLSARADMLACGLRDQLNLRDQLDLLDPEQPIDWLREIEIGELEDAYHAPSYTDGQA